MVEIIKQIDPPLGDAREDLDHPREEHVGASTWPRSSPRSSRSQLGTGQRRAGRRRRPGPPKAPPGPPGDLLDRDDHHQDHPGRALEQLIVIANERAYDWLVTLVQKLDVPIEEGAARRAHPRLLLRERQLRRAGRDAGRGHRACGLGRRRCARGRRGRRSAARPRRRRRRAGQASSRRPCCSRATCASTSTRPPTR